MLAQKKIAVAVNKTATGNKVINHIWKKGEENEQHFYERQAGISVTGIYGYANGPVHACEFAVQILWTASLWQRSVSRQ